jgi:hypothetical protein
VNGFFRHGHSLFVICLLPLALITAPIQFAHLFVDVSDGCELATALPPTARRIRRHYQVRDLSGVMMELIHIKEEQTR